MLLLNLFLLLSIIDPEPQYLAASYYNHQTSTIFESQVRFYVQKDSVFIEYIRKSQNSNIEGFVINHKRVQRIGNHYDISNGNQEYCLFIDNRQKMIKLESRKGRSLIMTSNKGRYYNQKLITFFLSKGRYDNRQ